jgi:hypothetical protein
MSYQAAISAAKADAQRAFEEAFPGTVTLGSQPYDAMVVLGPLHYEAHSDGGGSVRVQRITASISRQWLSQPPAKGTLLFHRGVEFKVGEVGGYNDSDAAFVIKAARFPK